MVYSYNEKLFSIKEMKCWYIYDMNEYQNYSEWKMPDISFSKKLKSKNIFYMISVISNARNVKSTQWLKENQWVPKNRRVGEESGQKEDYKWK